MPRARTLVRALGRPQFHASGARRGPLLALIAQAPRALAGCSGVQSALSPSGQEASRIATLFWWMAAGAVIVWVVMIALVPLCARMRSERRTMRRDRMLIIGGGVLIPTLVLTGLLVYGLAMLPSLVARAPAGSLQVEVIGEQWWWRVRYLRPGGGRIELANEIRLPVGEPVQFRLESDNVIHSFWVPSLAGKMDMIPGRVTYLTMHPTATGIFRGACAEYCGASHALMNFDVAVLERSEFTAWLEQQAAPARTPVDPLALRGRDLFFASGCSACHTVNGTAAGGVLGPDLTHVGSRLSLAAGVLPNDAGAFQRWIGQTTTIKPGAHMPRFGMLPQGDLRALAAYLAGLE